VKGVADEIDYGMRYYDPRAGRFMSVDPFIIHYPGNSPYDYAENEPLANVDLDGLEKANAINSFKYINEGFIMGEHEFLSTATGAAKTIASKNTYLNAWHSVSDFATTAVKDPNAALHSFEKGMTNASLSLGYGIANTVTEYTAKPLLWTLTISDRKKEDNLRGLGYGLWKGLELSATTAAPELLTERAELAGASQILKEQIEIPFTDRIFTHFTNLEGVSGITGINTKIFDDMAVGQSITVNRIAFGSGTNSFLQNAPGDIFVTDFSSNLSKGALDQIGVFGDKQNFGISFSEYQAFDQGVRVSGSRPDIGIYTVPGNTQIKGTITITKLRQ
jgi:hypothetical protein